MKNVTLWVHHPGPTPDEWEHEAYVGEALDEVLMRALADTPDVKLLTDNVQVFGNEVQIDVIACEDREMYESVRKEVSTWEL